MKLHPNYKKALEKRYSGELYIEIFENIKKYGKK